ncbi:MULTISPECIES: DUF6252 family protein [Mangrovimonas]|uniref:DUF6252 family protein n=1 Tax=Mangrovimonas TaxID=1211036 RepID=UPI001421A42A|nr:MULTISPECIES: DUF6252 family protein [Mangrovimonas]MCF1420402.1 DUF6252 family protein [Mangrovimonas futianensis]NIK91503.1 hypothetical protein [Mangrovimonas sp. CR14]
MKKHFTLLAYCLLFISLTNCNKDDDNTPQNPINQLPPATQTGENTFGCLVNGEPFAIENSANIVAIFQQGSLFISGEIDADDRDENISIFLNNDNVIVENGVYDLFNSTTNSGKFENQIESCDYNTTNGSLGTLTITHFDEVNFIISGDFQFEGYSDECSNVINITNGRFDMQYIP